MKKLLSNTTLRHIALTVVITLLMVACGGSGGGSSTSNQLEVDVGTDRTIVLSDTLEINATATQNGQPLQEDAIYSWEQLSGPGTVLISAAQDKDTTMHFSDIGSYQLRLNVSTVSETVYATLQVTVNQKAAGISGLAVRPSNTTECIAPATAPVFSGISLSTPFPDLPVLTSPLAMLMAPNDSNSWYVVQQTGQVLKFPNDATADTLSTFIDINDGRLIYGGERGLLGMAFHPDFATNGYVYLSYTNGESGLASRISRFSLDATGEALDPASEQIILSVAQPYNNHNGGQITFGPDGYLYIGFGDGGSGGDPLGNAQNTQTLLGAMLRIDVGDGSSSGYTIPANNPFSAGGGKAEIYAYGLRNPWRWSFDRDTGELWLGDVGQGSYEEVDIITKGANYGWNIMEGTHCYNATSCDQTGFTLPVAEYDHTEGLAVTGGYRYRGSAIPFLQGHYLYGDYSTGKIWGLEQTGPGTYASTELLDTALNISSFAEDHEGELYVINLGGSIRKIVGSSGGSGGEVPEQLSDWGCFVSSDPTLFSASVIPYNINALLWSDDATKGRFMAIPDGSTISVDVQGRFNLPVGSVVGKNFYINGKLIETRLLLHHTDPYGWKGYSYEWSDDQSDATLLSSSKEKEIDGQTWHYPSRAQCDSCHTAVAGFTLGPEVGQLNRPFLYPNTGIEANQLITFESIQLLSEALTDTEKSTTFYAIDDTAYSAERRSRSYLHANCAQCHQPGGPGGGNMDLRMGTLFANTRTCNEAPLGDTLGMSDPLIIAPGNADHSILVRRMEELGQHHMPPLAANVVDTQAVTVIREWIDSLSGCP